MASSYAVRSTPTETFDKITVSCWLKGHADGTQRSFWGLYDNSSSNRFFHLYYSTNGSLYGYWKQNEGTFFTLGTTQKFRDPNAWFHFVMTMDTTLSTAADRVKFYVNGERVTSFEDGLDTITQNQTCNLMNGTTDGRMQWGGGKQSGTQYYWNGSMSHCHMCVGYAYDASYFGSTDSTTGQWQINTSPNVSYGTNGGFWFKDGSQLTDSSTNSNTLTSSGTLTNTEDNPSNNFCTFNAINPYAGTLANGNLKMTQNNFNSNCQGTLGMESGKYYWEYKIDGPYGEFGVCEQGKANQSDPQSNIGFYFLYNNGNTVGYVYNNATSGSQSSQITVSAFANGMILNLAYDADNGALYIGQNGTWLNSGDPTSGSSATGALITNISPRFNGTIVPFCGHGTTSTTANYEANFGNGYFGTTAITSEGTNASNIGKFEYDVPTGYTALSTKGLNE